MNELAASLRCETTAITAQEQLTAAQARIKVLEDKYEPKETK